MQAELITIVDDKATSYDLTTLTNVKDELGISSTVSDAALRRYITSASVAAAQYCNRVFQIETMKEEFFIKRDRYSRLIPGGADFLQLSRWPVDEVASVVQNGVTLVEDTDFKVDYEKGYLLRIDENGFSRKWSIDPTLVEYDGGYETVPADVEDAVIRMVSSRYIARGRDKSVRQENIPGVREVTYWIATGKESGNLPPDVTDILDNYRVPVISS